MSGPTITFIPAPGSPLRVLPEVPPPVIQLPLLEARRVHQTKVWRKRRDGRWGKETSADEKFFRRHVVELPYGDIDALGDYLASIAPLSRVCATSGQPVGDGRLNEYVRRLKHAKGNAPATWVESADYLLFLDIDDIDIPGADIQESPDLVVMEIIDRLGADFADASYCWYFSGGQKPDGDLIKLRLVFFTDRALTNEEKKRWAKSCPVVVDQNIYKAGGLVFTADPLFIGPNGESLPDWLPVRRGVIQGDRDAVSLTIPDAPQRPVPAFIPEGERIHAPGVLKPLVAAIERAIEGDRHRIIFGAARAAGGYVAGGAVSADEALSALMRAAIASGSAGADRAVVDGMAAGTSAPLYAPNPLDDLPDDAPWPDFETLSIEAAIERVNGIIADLTANPKNADGEYRRVVVRTPPGFGKTELAINAIRGNQKTLWMAPTNELGMETEDRFNANQPPVVGNLAQYMANPARAMMGRLAPDPRSNPEKPVTLCRKPEALAALKEQGLSRHTKILLCKRKDDPHNGCEFLRDGLCGYYRQMSDPAPVRIVAHNFLNLYQAEMISDFVDTGDLAVIDENPRGALFGHAHWCDAPESKSAGSFGGWLSDPLLRTVAGAVLDGKPIENREALLEECSAIVDELESGNVPDGVYPYMSEAESAQAIRNWTPPTNPARMGMYLAAQRYLGTGRNTLWASKIDGYPALFSAWISGHETIRNLPALMLDATANETNYRAIFGSAVEFHGFDVPMAAGVGVDQICDSTLYQRKVDPSAKKADLVAARKMVQRLAAWATLNGTESHPAGVISYQGTADGVFSKVMAGCVLTGHFNALRGLNLFSDVAALCVAGRLEPGVQEAEAMARALWPDADLQLGETDYTRVKSFYQMRDGRRVPCAVRSHPDPRVAAVIRSVREEELIQAIGRGRYIHSQGQRRLLVATSVPIPGLIVDRLLTLDEALPEARLSAAIGAGAGVVPLSAGWLTERCREWFPNADSAKEWLKSFKGGFTGNSIFTRESPFENTAPDAGFKGTLSGKPMVLVAYRIAGQRGGKARRALVADGLNPARALERIHGVPITLTLSESPDAAAPDVTIPIPDPIPFPIPIKETKPVGNLIALFGPDGFTADANWAPEDEADADLASDDRDTFTAPIIAGLIANGWHPCNARARADADWLWRHGPPVIAGGLLRQRAVA